MNKWILCLLLIIGFSIPATVHGQKPQPNLDFTIHVSAGPEKSEFELVLTNKEQKPVTLEFPTSQKYEIIVKDPLNNNNEVYRFSKHKSFAQAIQTITLEPMQSLKWTEEWDYHTNGQRIKEGKYSVSARLTATRVNDLPLKKNQQLKSSANLIVQKENPIFQNVKVTGKNGNYIVKVEVRPHQRNFYYSVEDGHNILVPENRLESKSKYPAWSKFSFRVSVPKDSLPDNGTIVLNLYEKSNQDDLMLYVYPVILEKFYD